MTQNGVPLVLWLDTGETVVLTVFCVQFVERICTMSSLWDNMPFFAADDVQFDTTCDSSDEFPILRLPRSIIMHVLSFLRPNDLLRGCRNTCQLFRDLVDSHALWKAKCERDNKTVPNFRFDTLPDRYYQAIYKHDPYGVNLLKNPSGSTGKGKFAHWRIISSGGDGWRVECPPKGADPVPIDNQCCFGTSYYKCSKQQTVDLRKVGVLPEVMDQIKPPIEASEWYAARFDCGSIYQMRVELLDSTRKPLMSRETGKIRTEQWEGRQWKQVRHVLSGYPEGVRFVRFLHKGVDTQFWAGHYGAKMAGASIRILHQSDDDKTQP